MLNKKVRFHSNPTYFQKFRICSRFRVLKVYSILLLKSPKAKLQPYYAIEKSFVSFCFQNTLSGVALPLLFSVKMWMSLVCGDESSFFSFQAKEDRKNVDSQNAGNKKGGKNLDMKYPPSGNKNANFFRNLCNIF